ncbi:ribbon-helix-helix protein, CopG family [Microtetraspora niveoalba]|uniref:ribbon-helix-helix protein, CopG family n=1 Tax=Microtetraspora niveoalba TaxID=46175 RepID=UPI00082B676D|nr:ribbon-helix-helix protein, CopG family [Microtetraspora niveoalba]
MSTEPKTTTIRVSFVTRDEIAKLAEQEGKSMTAVVEQAIRQYERKQFWTKVRAQIERTKQEDPEAWEDYLTEVQQIDGARSTSVKIAPEWEGLVDLPEGDR